MDTRGGLSFIHSSATFHR